MLYDGETPLYPLTPKKLTTLASDGYIDFPDITEKEIKDRSKGDVLSKSLVILQTGWFIVQCVARAVEHLPVTELELVTVAFATLNFVTYVFWWNKPLNVQQPLRVLLKKPIVGQTGQRKSVEDSGITEWVGLILSVVIGEQDDYVDLTTEKRVPTFYSGDLKKRQRLHASLGAAVIAMIFGAIHCIAWSFPFPTLAEKILWRVSSIVIIGVPFLFLASFGLHGFLSCFDIDIPDAIVVVVLSVTTILFLLLYVAARLVLLVQAFTTLRSLPSEAFQTVHWTTFIPHF